MSKKIINGKMYNTETAARIGRHGSEGLSQSDFRYFEETLYQKKTGEFFLAGEGHGMTKYASSMGNASGYGYDTIPLSIEDAKKWVEKHMTADEYVLLFGEVKE